MNVYLTLSRDNFILCLYCLFRLNKYISVCFLAPASTFFFNFRINFFNCCQKGEISDLLIGKATYVIAKIIKNYIWLL